MQAHKVRTEDKMLSLKAQLLKKDLAMGLQSLKNGEGRIINIENLIRSCEARFQRKK